MRLFLLTASLLVLSACAEPNRNELVGASGSDGNGGVSSGTTTSGGGSSGSSGMPSAGSGIRNDSGAAPTVGCNKMDVLFVIDNSGSMSEEKANLIANFPRFIEVLDSFRNGALDYRLGVTTTAMGQISFLGPVLGAEEGALLRTESMTDPWLDRGEPNLTGTFSQLADVELNGSPNEQPLKAAQFALRERVDDGTNAGFHRPDALLAFVFLTDEDDSSSDRAPTMATGDFVTDLINDLGEVIPGPMAPVSDFVASYDQIAGGRDRWAAAVIAGDQQPECSSEFGDADYAERLIEFVELSGQNALLGSICDGDLSPQLDQALDTFAVACNEFVPII